MSAIQNFLGRLDASAIGIPHISEPSAARDVTSIQISELLKRLSQPSATFTGRRVVSSQSLSETLYDALASFKTKTSQVAMHLNREARDKMFAQLDSLLSIEDWEPDDRPPSIDSFTTFLRLVTFIRPERRPGLGATHDGTLIATWDSGKDTLTIECLPKDLLRWNLAAAIDGEIERAAAVTPLGRLKKVLEPYSPTRWFNYEHPISFE